MFALSALLFLARAGDASTLFVAKFGDGSDGFSWETAYTLIGDAIDAATAEDEIWVASGTYNETAELKVGVHLFGGFAGTERTMDFDLRNWLANPTIMDASGLNDRVVVAADDTLLDGFTLTGGKATRGGGILCRNARCKLRNCKVVANRAEARGFVSGPPGIGGSAGAIGGGLLFDGSVVSMESCSICSNSVSASAGSFSGGSAWAGGGGIAFINGCNACLRECSVEDNRCASYAAGRVTSAWSEGGGLSWYDESSMVMEDSVIRNNTVSANADSFSGLALNLGAGIFGNNSSAKLSNCLVTDNGYFYYPPEALPAPPSTKYGAGLYSSDSILDLSHCTVSENEWFLTRELDGIYCVNTVLKVINSILWNGVNGLVYDTTPTVQYSSVRGGFPGPGNIDAEPHFVNPSDGNFRFQYGSPCVDSGTITEILTDLDGNPRPVDVIGVGFEGAAAFDMGTYEFQLPEGDLNSNGFTDPMDLFLFQRDWMKGTDVAGPGSE